MQNDRGRKLSPATPMHEPQNRESTDEFKRASPSGGFRAVRSQITNDGQVNTYLKGVRFGHGSDFVSPSLARQYVLEPQ